MLFESIVEKIVHESFSTMVDSERQRQIRLIGKAWDYYYGEQEKYIKQYEGEEYEEHYEKDKLYFNYTKAIVEQYLEGIFAKPVIITLNDKNQQETWKNISDPITFFKILNFLTTVQRIAEISATAIVMIRYNQATEQVYFEDVRGEYVTFLPDPNNPREVGTLIISYDYDTGEIDPKKRFLRRIEIWDKDNWAIWLYSNSLKQKKILKSGKNPYGFIPAIKFVPEQDDNTFYGITGIHDIVKINESYNNLWTALMEICVMQSFSILLIKSELELDFKIAPKKFVKLESITGGEGVNDAKYITPDPKISDVKGVLESLKNELQDFSKVPSEVLQSSKELNPVSGYALRIKRIPIEQVWDRRKVSYGPSLKTLVKNAIIIDAIHKKKEPPKEIIVSIEFANTKPALSPNEQIIIDESDLRYNIITPIDIMMRRFPMLTKEEAVKKLEENKTLNEEYGVGKFGTSEELDVFMQQGGG